MKSRDGNPETVWKTTDFPIVRGDREWTRSWDRNEHRTSRQTTQKDLEKIVDGGSVLSVDWSGDKTCEIVLGILKTNPRATLNQAADMLKLSRRGIEQAVRRLKKAYHLEKVGGKRFGHWEIIRRESRMNPYTEDNLVHRLTRGYVPCPTASSSPASSASSRKGASRLRNPNAA